MTVGQVISRTFSVLFERLGTLIGLWGIYFVLQFVAIAVLGIAMAALSAGGGITPGLAGGGLSTGMVVMVVAFYLAYFLIYFAQSASLTAASSPFHRTGFGEAIGIGMRGALPLLGVMILLAIGYLVVALVFMLLGAVLSTAGRAGAVILAVLALPAAVFLACRLSVVNAVVAVERVANPVTAITRSWAITKGHVLAILGSIVALGAVLLLIFAVAFIPFYTSVKSASEAGAEPNFGLMIVGFLGIVIASVVMVLVMSALVAVIHAELVDDMDGAAAEVFG